jgi:hypothetical protein
LKLERNPRSNFEVDTVGVETGIAPSRRPLALLESMRAGGADLRRLIFASGTDGVVLAGVQLHRAIVWTLAALVASAAAALALRFLTADTVQSVEWYNFGFLDQRWLVLGYWLGVASLLLVPLWVMRSQSFWPDAAAAGIDRGEARGGLRVVIALVAYTLWLGPPWNLELLARPMEWHEIAHLGPLQALLAGSDFYLESGTQYGPGMQMLSLHYLENFGVSLLRFREFWLWMNFVGGLIVVGWMARLFPALPLFLGLIAFRFLSPFHFFEAVEGGSYTFFFGWASCARYAGAIHAVLALAWVLGRPAPADGSATTPAERIFLLVSGIVWGFFVQISQENLGCGLAGIALLAAFAWLTRAAAPRRLFAIAGPFAVGTLIAILPIVALFAGAGELDGFVRRYFEIGSYVASGYSNTPLQESWGTPAGLLFRALPLAAIAVFAVASFDRSLPRAQRTTTAAAAILTLACFAPALLRTDSAHILAAATPVGLLVAAGCFGMRRDAAPASRLIAVVAVLPLLACLRFGDLATLAREPLARVRAFATADQPREIVGGRVGYRYDLDAPYSTFSGLTLGDFLELNRRIREVIGDRPVEISSAIGTRGHWYFFGGLRPNMPDPEPSMTIVNSRLRARYLAELDRLGIPCLISTGTQDAEFRIYHEQPGSRREWTLPTSEKSFYVSCLDEIGAS